MLDVIVDVKLERVREHAKKGNLDCVTYLATCIQQGKHTAKNPALAMDLFNYVIARKDDVDFKETYWNALCQKTHLLDPQKDAEAIDEISLELVRDITQYPPEEWDYGRLISAARWLRDRLGKEDPQDY